MKVLSSSSVARPSPMVDRPTKITEVEFRVVDRGPNWLFVRAPCGVLSASSHQGGWAEQLRTLLDRHFTYRVVLEMDDVEQMDAEAAQELVHLCRWLARRQGVLRLCGLRPESGRWMLQLCDGTMLHNHPSRQAAVVGCPRCDEPPRQLPAPSRHRPVNRLTPRAIPR